MTVKIASSLVQKFPGAAVVESSNKNLTPVKSTKEHESEGKTGPSVFIDKIAFVITPHTEKDAVEIHKAIWVALSDTSVFQPAGANAKKGWGRAVHISLASTHHRVLFQYRWEPCSLGGNPAHQINVAKKLRLEFNPRKIGSDGLMELAAIVDTMFDDNWAYLLKHGRVTRLDLAVDLPNVKMDDVHFLPKQGASQIQWSQDGKLQTFCLGKPAGSQTLVYDVGKKRQAKGQKLIGPPRVRVERRMRNPPLQKMTDLPSLPNPFVGMALTLLPNDPPENASNELWMWQLFQDAIRARGLTKALALLPIKRRAAYRKHLKQHPAPVWNPHEIWANWPKVCATFLSGGMMI